MDINLMISIFPSLLNGAVITLKLLASSIFFGLLIGLLFAILRINKNPIINKFAYGYSYFFRGTPLLVQLYLIYYGLANIEFLRNSFLWVIIREPYWCNYCIFIKYWSIHIWNFKIGFPNNKRGLYRGCTKFRCLKENYFL